LAVLLLAVTNFGSVDSFQSLLSFVAEKPVSEVLRPTLESATYTVPVQQIYDLCKTIMRPVIQVAAVRKTYGSTVAVDEVSFEVNDGEIFGLIGPNGAGQTTTMECIEGLRTPDRGTISVTGTLPQDRL
jgi:ABC-type polysaccharide/polyol phosphate transport system ATPase subunit